MDAGPKNWMTNLNDNLKSKPLIHLAIPGSHDCMTYTISAANGMSPDNETAVEYFHKVFGKLARKFIYKWCVTQDMNITDQLELGIRYLDFRVATKKRDSKIYFCHGLYGAEVSSYLAMINMFLDENKGEVIIMDFQHFYAFSAKDHERLINDLLKPTFGNKLCPYPSQIKDVTLHWMRKNGFQAILIYRDKAIENKDIDRLWPGPAWPTPWPNASSVGSLKNFLKTKINGRDIDLGHVTQFLLTPDAKFLALHPIGGIKTSCANKLMKHLKPWLKEQTPGTREGCINVVLADYIAAGEFYNLVIGLNNFFVEKYNN